MGKRHKLIVKIEGDVIGYGAFFASTEAAQMHVDRIFKSTWYKSLTQLWSLRVVHPVKGPIPYFCIPDVNTRNAEIRHPPGTMCERHVIHEMTHGLFPYDPKTSDDEDHGPEFVGALIEMYRRYLAIEEATKLRQAFLANEVSFLPRFGRWGTKELYDTLTLEQREMVKKLALLYLSDRSGLERELIHAIDTRADK